MKLDCINLILRRKKDPFFQKKGLTFSLARKIIFPRTFFNSVFAVYSFQVFIFFFSFFLLAGLSLAIINPNKDNYYKQHKLSMRPC